MTGSRTTLGPHLPRRYRHVRRRSTNSPNAAALPEQADLDARIRTDELAFRMQATGPEAVDLAQETEDAKAIYGLDEKPTAAFGRTPMSEQGNGRDHSPTGFFTM